jgi:hypothetical protein
MIIYDTIKTYYFSNERFRAYVDRYSVKHAVDVDTALTHAGVREVYKYYKSREV